MKNFRTACLLATALLAGCNTSDALVPRESVGTGGMQTSPVTQEETAYLARSAQPESASTAPLRQPLPPPQNTLEAQARALESGAAVSPAASPPLSGQTPLQQAAQQTLAPQTAALPAASGQTIRFLPIIGAPVQAVTPLSRQLGSSARASGLTIKGTNDTDARHVLKGYLSAFADGGSIKVVYVWDVLDGEGVRLHRIQGEESVAGKGADPWAAVPAATMESIGSKTISAYREWLASAQG